MPTVYEGELSSKGLRIALVCGRFNQLIVQPLLDGAIDAIGRTGGRRDDSAVFWCPGSFEIPQLLRRVVGTGAFDAAVCLGAVIRGATPHFDYVAGAVARGVAHIAQSAAIPITFGVITTDTIEQALERAGTKAGNKGFDAAMAAIEMACLYRAIDAGWPAREHIRRESEA
ncbi:MAG: 6,7-dimethyl-8-ribityllumazine synthase [Proteobacteria bacterium]|nr:6,7-dimethyl-8-ribityllumazine synthase [Pseudomonadota bacterium]